MTIKGKEFEVDFTDADMIERVESERKKILDKCKELENNKDIGFAEGIRQECKILKEFLDCVFGEGTSKEAFGEKDSLKDLLKAYEDTFEEMEKQQKYVNDVFNKYSPDRLK